MAGVLGAASIPFIGCVALLVAMVLQILSFATPNWAKIEGQHFGLWKWAECKDVEVSRAVNGRFDVQGCYMWESKWNVEDWLNAVRGLESCTILFWSIPLVILPVYIYVALGLKYRSLLATMTVFTLIGAACNLVGVIIFAIKVGESDSMDVGWCLIVCAIAFVPGFIAFIIFLIATFKRPKFSHERHYVSGFYVDPDRNRMYVVENVEPPTVVERKEPLPSVQNGGVDNPAMASD